MLGTMNTQMRATVAEAMRKREARRGTCLYFAQGERCACVAPVRCPHYAAGVCIAKGDCQNFCAHYSTPPAILKEEVGLR